MMLSTVSHIKDRSSEFQQLINRGNISTVYQPIFSLTNGKTFGYEALTRGPEDSFFHNPINLFTYAESNDFLFPTEKLARESAIRNSTSFLKPNEKLFINFSPKIIHDPNFAPGVTVSLLQKYSLSPADVVFEITERQAIDDFKTFRTALNYYREQGFKIAIDDAGAGYSSAQAIIELSPDFIKLDRSLTSEIHRSEVKEKIVESFITIANKCNSQVIAEGIESREELCKVMELGADYGQGYVFAKPLFPPVKQLNGSLQYCISNCKTGNPIGNIMEPINTLDHLFNPDQVTHIFLQNRTIQRVIITKKDQPIYTINRKSWLQQKEEIENSLNNYTIVDCDTDINKVVKSVLNDQTEHVLVKRNNQFCGIVSIYCLLEYLHKK